MKSKIIKAVIACVIVVGIGFGGYYGYNKVFAKKQTTSTVQTYEVSATKMNLKVTVQGTGSAYAGTTKDVAANNNGTLGSLSVKVGDTVTAGQKLFVVSSDDISQGVTTAKNNLTKANLTLDSDESADKVDENKVEMDELSVSDAKTQLNDAYKQANNMTVTAPISGVVTAVNNSNGDDIQSGKAVLTIQDLNSMKIKVSVDELDIEKIKVGQKATIKFDAITDKTYDGSVESIAETGTTSNNVTSYDVVVAVSKPDGIKLGMNANVTIAVESKDNALVIPEEALVELNGQKFVRVASTDSTTQTGAQTSTSTSSGNSKNQSQNGQTSSQSGSGRNSGRQSYSGTGKLIPIKTGLETQNYIEVTDGLTEGEKVLVQLPSTSSTTTNSNRNSMNGGFGGGFGGDMGGGPMPQGGGNAGGQGGNSKN